MQRGGQTELLSGADDARRKSRSLSSSSLSVLDVYQWVEIEVDLEIKESLYQGTAENSIEVLAAVVDQRQNIILWANKKKTQAGKSW